jgi:uncharacterized membrane protein YdjX (TVP38/TMEM64 family)
MSRKILVFLTLVLIIAVVYVNVTGEINSQSMFQSAKNQQVSLNAYVLSHPTVARLIFLTSYILFCIGFLPGISILTLLGGSMFGLIEGIVLVAVASTSGATLSFLIARYFVSEQTLNYLSRNFFYKQFSVQLGRPLFLLALRLLPAIPFNFLNLAMALTTIPITKFIIYSLLGMLPMICLTVNVGTHLSQVSSISGLVSPEIKSSFIYLGGFIFIVSILSQFLKAACKK